MDIQSIIRYVSYLVLAIMFALFPSRKKRFSQKAGECLLSLPKKKRKLVFAVFVCAPLLILIQKFRSFELYMNIVLSGCALLGVEIAIRDLILSGMSGVYKNALIVDARCIMFDSILNLPTLSYENDKTEHIDTLAADAEHTAAKSLKIVTEKNGTIFVGFDTAEDRQAAVSVILEQNPRLRV